MTNGNTYVKDTKAPDDEYSFYWIFPFYYNSEGKRIVGTTPKTYVYAKGITAPVNDLKATNITGGVKLAWGAVKDADGYIIYAKRPGETKFSYISMTTKNLTYTDKQASTTDWTFYRVFPFHMDAEGKRIIGESGNYTYGKAK